MAQGADGSGDDMVSGRVNRADSHTVIWAQVPPPGEVHFAGGAILRLEVAKDPVSDDYEESGGFRPPNFFHGLVSLGHSGGGSGFPFGGSPASGVIGCGGLNNGTGVVGVGGGNSHVARDPEREHGAGGIGVHGLGGSPDPFPGLGLDVAPGPGVIGQGARQHDWANTLRRPHAAGVIGIAGGIGGGNEIDRKPMDLLPLHGLLETGGTGVYGQGADANVVMAGGEAGTTPSGPLAAGTGVMGRGGIATDSSGPGRSLPPSAAGVIGLSGAVPIPPITKTGNAGVYGFGAIAGVRGEADVGAGVSGLSRVGRGGRFFSEQSAQIQLVPRDMNAAYPQRIGVTPTVLPPNSAFLPLPKNGQGGDLLAIMDNQRHCTLWFCVDGEVVGSTPAQWAQVLLGPNAAGSI